jgi:hypothetical protein
VLDLVDAQSLLDALEAQLPFGAKLEISLI